MLVLPCCEIIGVIPPNRRRQSADEKALLAFAKEHDRFIRQVTQGLIQSRLENLDPQKLLEKWNKGAKEHGPFTLRKVDGLKELEDECMDAYWYTAIFLLQDEP